MFGLIETELLPRPSPWGRLLFALKRETGVRVSEQRVWGASLARTKITFWCDDPNNRRRAETALACLRDAGVRGVVLPRSFAFRELLPAYGLIASTPVPLYRRMAARMAALAADQLHVEPPRLRLCFMAKRMTPEVSASMEAMCARARHMLLSLDRGGGGEVCRWLQRNAGVSVLENPTPEQMAETDVYLVFDGWEEGRRLPAKKDSAVLLLGGGHFQIPAGRLVADGAVLYPPMRLREHWPWDADNEALLTALVAAGAVSPGEIQLRALRTMH